MSEQKQDLERLAEATGKVEAGVDLLVREREELERRLKKIEQRLAALEARRPPGPPQGP